MLQLDVRGIEQIWVLRQNIQYSINLMLTECILSQDGSNVLFQSNIDSIVVDFTLKTTVWGSKRGLV